MSKAKKAKVYRSFSPPPSIITGKKYLYKKEEKRDLFALSEEWLTFIWICRRREFYAVSKIVRFIPMDQRFLLGIWSRGIQNHHVRWFGTIRMDWWQMWNRMFFERSWTHSREFGWFTHNGVSIHLVYLSNNTAKAAIRSIPSEFFERLNSQVVDSGFQYGRHVVLRYIYRPYSW